MKTKKPASVVASGPTAKLRHAAERWVLQEPAGVTLPTAAEAHLAQLVHELQIHQIELEMQKEESAQTREDTEGLLAEYTDLYDFSPTGNLSLDHAGTILKINLTGAWLLGADRSRLVGRQFSPMLAVGSRPGFAAFLHQVLSGGGQTSAEVELPQESAVPLALKIEGVLSSRGPICRAVLLDIAPRRKAEVARGIVEQRYRQLFELAKEGILILDAVTGLVTDVNPFLVERLGYSREHCLGKKVWELGFLKDLVANQDSFLDLQHIHSMRFESITMETSAGQRLEMEVILTAYQVHDQKVIQCNLRDISGRQRVEAYRRMGQEFIEILRTPGHPQESLHQIIAILRAHTDWSAVGIRLEEGEDFPYVAQQGFSLGFSATENTLLARTPEGAIRRNPDGRACLECTCGLVISGKADLARPFCTPGGSFWTNDSFALLNLPASEDPRLCPRNVCVHQGYASVALIPIRNKERIMGLLQCNDRRKGCFTHDTIELLEGLTALIGEGLARQQAEASAHERKKELHCLHAIQHQVQADASVAEICRHAAAQLVQAMQHPALAGAVVEVMGERFTAGKDAAGPELHAEIQIGGQRCGRVEVHYAQERPFLLPFESNLINGVAEVLSLWLQRQRATMALRESEGQFRAMFELASVGMAQADPITGRFLRVNGKMCAITGYSASELLERRIVDLTHPEDQPKDRAALEGVVRGETLDYRLEKRYMRKDGTTVWVNVNVTVLRDEAGQPHRTMATVEDITERQRAGLALRESDARFVALAQHSSTISWEVDAQGLYTYISPVVETILGCRPDEVVSRRHFFDLHPEEGRAAFQAAVLAVFDQRGEFQNLIHPAETKDGRRVWLSTDGLPVLNADGTLRGYRGSDTDITAQRLVEASHERLATAVEASAETIIITDANGTIVYTNPAFAKTSGYTREEALGQNPRLLKSGQHDEAFYRQMWATLRAGQVWTGRMVNRRKDWTHLEEEASISPVFDAAGQIINYVAVKHDITHEVELEAQFRHMQKMEAVGQLAGGVAHDFNNILTVVLMHTELAKDAAGLSTDTRESLDEIEKAGHRAMALTRQLLLFSRREVMRTETVDMKSAVTLFHKMLQRILGEDVRLQLNLHSRPLWVRADPGMIDQVLLNLSVNARDAMPTGGQLIIDTGEKTLTAEQALRNPEAAPGRHVWISVRDTGEGIPPEVLPRIFEPFFTTKAVGKGTGLGLATVFGIVKQHGGWIEVFSVVGRGTTFQVYLPACACPASEAVVAEAAPKPQGGTETILLVEDESTVRQVAQVVLQRAGYRVLGAPDGPSALALSRQHESAIDLLLTDLVMPEGMDGRAVAEQLLLDRPGLKVIFMSGYSPELAGRDLALLPGQQFLQKPCSTNHLLETIRDCLVN